ncbi:MAG: molybdenum cofactor guanylyltransferase [Candidatus Binatia bacterium]
MLTASAIILVGGKSSRMGRAKALLPFDDEPILVHSVRTLREIVTDVVVVAAPQQEVPPLPATVIRDDIPHQGPVGGLFYGLRAVQHELCFVTACDAPFLHRRLVEHLFTLAPHYDAVVPRWRAQLQPLHAVYHRSVLPLLRAQLDQGELRLLSLLSKVRIREVSNEELQRFDDVDMSFHNLNRPEDYAEALARWQARRNSEC